MADPMRATEELALMAVLHPERRCSRVPLGEGAFDLLAAPGGPLTRPAPPGPSGARQMLQNTDAPAYFCRIQQK